MVRRKRIVWASVIAASAAGVALFWYGAYRGFNHVETAENVPRVPWLPESATNVSYYRSYLWTAYEFSIDERAFLQLTRDQGLDVRPIGPEPFTIKRYSFDAGRRMYPAALPEGASEAEIARYDEAVSRSEEAQHKTIRRGYWYRNIRSNGGGTSWAYDLDSGRAYYDYSAR